MLALPIRPRARPGRRKKPRPVPYPTTESLRYVTALRGILGGPGREMRAYLKAALPPLLGQVQAPRGDDARSDIERLIGNLRAMIGLTVERAEQTAVTMVSRVAARHAVQFAESADGVFAVNPMVGSESWLPEQMRLATAENVRLIKSIPEEFLTQIEGIVSRAAAAGKRAEEIAPEIVARFGVSNSRAVLIARDQVGKWSGNLTRLRQVDAGISEYEWITSRDERVRPEHAARHGKRFKWSDPPSDGHPGQPIRCRCTASPVIPEDG